MRTMWDIDGVGFTFGDSVKKHMDHTGLGHLWKSGKTSKPYWDWYKDYGWDTARFVAFCHEAADCGCLFSGDVRPGYVESIRRVAQMGHDIIIATDRSFGATPAVSERLTVEWLRQHGIEYDELYFTSYKPDSHCHVAIDDKIQNYDELVLAGTDTYLLNRPWNQVPGGDARQRIDSIEEYAEAIEDATSLGYIDLTFA